MLPILHYMYSATSPIKYMHTRVSYRIFLLGGGSNCKGSGSMRKHGDTHVSVQAT